MDLKSIIQNCAPAKVLAVSKLQTEEKIRLLYTEGQRDFGENYVQEALEKIEHLNNCTDIAWHFIGRLQKNKAKFVVGKFALIHSVDSVELAQALSKQCQSQNVQQKILLQVNLAKEESKSGFDEETLQRHWEEIQHLPGLIICGLMTMPPLTETGEEVRPYFKGLRGLLEKLRTSVDPMIHPMNELSMGTSHDFKVAIEEGATIVRLGTILFGERPSKM